MLNIAGCVFSAVLLVLAMRSTHKDDACHHLIRFEWMFLATLLLSALEQARALIFFQCGGGPTMFVHLTIWVSGVFFSRYLRGAFS